MVILDTDLLSILFQDQRPAADRLRTRLAAVPPSEVFTTIITYQEQIQGWMTSLSKARTPTKLLLAYKELFDLVENYRAFPLLPFEAAAQETFERLRRQKVRTPTMDLRIACIALAKGAMLLTRNLRDFRQVPGLSVEDWSR